MVRLILYAVAELNFGCKDNQWMKSNHGVLLYF